MLGDECSCCGGRCPHILMGRVAKHSTRNNVELCLQQSSSNVKPVAFTKPIPCALHMLTILEFGYVLRRTIQVWCIHVCRLRTEGLRRRDVAEHKVMRRAVTLSSGSTRRLELVCTVVCYLIKVTILLLIPKAKYVNGFESRIGTIQLNCIGSIINSILLILPIWLR